ncbi:MAG: hypothetical protein GDA44_12795 [Prochloron sp. SP5CPC1]|nr:hypothetical protein [Candidatus Paraprochloron terpiosi SP5CPC1]
MLQNEILDEIRKIREEHAKSFNYDLDAMFADWQKKEAESGRKVVNLSAEPRRTKRWIGQTQNLDGESIRC